MSLVIDQYRAGAVSDADADAFFAQFTTAPTTGLKTDVTTLFLAAKANGWWAGTDLLTLFPLETVQSTKLNARYPDNTKLVSHDHILFTANRGLAFERYIAGYDEESGDPYYLEGSMDFDAIRADGANFGAAAGGCGYGKNVAESAYDPGLTETTGYTRIVLDATGAYSAGVGGLKGRTNSNSGGSQPPTYTPNSNTTGSAMVLRTSGSQIRLIKDQNVSSALGDNFVSGPYRLRYLGPGNGNTTTRPRYSYVWSGNLTTAQAQAFHADIATFIAARAAI